MLAATLFASASSTAKDLCIDAANGLSPTEDRPIIVGRTFKIPKRNKCSPFQGVIVSEESAVTGVACTSFDSDHVSFTLTETVSPESAVSFRGVRFYSARLQIATATGNLKIIPVGDGGPTSDLAITAYDCTGTYPDNL